jgi:hypothetical protein
MATKKEEKDTTGTLEGKQNRFLVGGVYVFAGSGVVLNYK